MPRHPPTASHHHTSPRGALKQAAAAAWLGLTVAVLGGACAVALAVLALLAPDVSADDTHAAPALPPPWPDAFGGNETALARQAWVFLATRDSFLRPVLQLNEALLDVGTRRQRIVMAGPDVGAASVWVMEHSGLRVLRIGSAPSHGNYRPHYERWGPLLSKLEVFGLEGLLDRAVFLDLDITVHANVDDLFNFREPIVTMQDNHGCFMRPPSVNSGVMSVRPSKALHSELLRILEANVITGGDQEIVQLWYNSSGRTPVVLTEAYAAFVWRCNCFLHGQIPSFTQPKIVHFTNWGIDYNHVSWGGSDGVRTKCARPHYERWKAMNDAAGRRIRAIADAPHSNATREIRRMLKNMYPVWDS
eukprot:m51a1_g10875 hypothetical protein (361) ;mRNA; f:10365-11896